LGVLQNISLMGMWRDLYFAIDN